jgi:hypothetical protein
LRRLIRAENKIDDASESKKLDKYLRKAFKNEVKPLAKEKPIETGKPSKFGLFE